VVVLEEGEIAEEGAVEVGVPVVLEEHAEVVVVVVVEEPEVAGVV